MIQKGASYGAFFLKWIEKILIMISVIVGFYLFTIGKKLVEVTGNTNVFLAFKNITAYLTIKEPDSYLVLSLVFMIGFCIYCLILGIIKSINYLSSVNNESFDENIDKKIQNKANEINGLIFTSAFKYMKEQYKVILSIGLVVGLLLYYNNFYMGIGFFTGAIFSCITAVFNMYLCTTTNIKIAMSANKSLKDAFNTALKTGLSGSLFTLSMSIGVVLLGVLISILVDVNFSKHCFNNLGFGMAFGCSFICIFGRLAGGIFTKAADVGADLVGKVEAALAEDDIRNPAVIADNVGDNVGDGHGMIVDVFESYVVTMIMGLLWSGESLQVNFYLKISYFILSLIGLFTTYFAKYFISLHKSVWGKLQIYLYTAIFLNIILLTAWFLGTYSYFNIDINIIYKIISCSFIGFFVSASILKSTEYYTSSKYAPVKNLAQASTSGHGTNVIYGLSIYYMSVAIPVAILVIGILISYSLMGVTGVILSALSMIALTGPIVTLDLIGPTTDNAGGIAEMSGMGQNIRDITDHLDAVGNVTKAMTKGFAIGSATFTAIATNMLFVSEVLQIKKISISCNIANPFVLSGFFIGGIITFVFCGLAMKAVGEAAKDIVLNIREQFQQNPEILNGNQRPDYMESIKYLTKTSIKKMIIPALLPIGIPILSFYVYQYYFGAKFIYDFLLAISMGNTIVGIFTAISMTVTGGAWDNCKKYIEEGHFGGKGSDTHKCAVTGDTVGDPLKDTAGPAINVLIKVLGIVISLFVILSA